MTIKAKIITFIFLASILIFSCVNISLADVGPIGISPQGGTLQAGSQSTNVSMNYENVILTYGKPQKREIMYENADVPHVYKTMSIHVSALFKMMNNGDKTENVSVFFPSDTGVFAQGVSIGDSGITNFKVNGKELVKENLSYVSVLINGFEQKASAYQWQETFYPQKENQIIIEYDSEIREEAYNVYYLAYVLGTGRGWQGPIKKGEVTFILPQDLALYAITSKPPQMEENKLPFQVEGNSIKLSFFDYEPDSNETILLGVYDFNIVDEIEQLKKEQSAFSNNLKIAGLFRQLTWDTHCVLCTGVTTKNTKNYYDLAFTQAASKDELNLALVSFTYGIDGSEKDYAIKMNNLLSIMSLKCSEFDPECNKESIYFGRGYFDGTPFSSFFGGKSYEEYVASGKIEVPNGDFLRKYADKMQKYDKSLSVLANNFLKGIPTNSVYSWQNIIIDDNQSAGVAISPGSTTSPDFTPEENKISKNIVQQPTQQKNILLIVAIGILFAVLIIFALL